MAEISYCRHRFPPVVIVSVSPVLESSVRKRAGWRRRAPSLELIRHLVDAGLGAGLVFFAAWRTRNSDGADDLVADLDRQCTLRRNDPGQMHGAVVGLSFTRWTNSPDGMRKVRAV